MPDSEELSAARTQVNNAVLNFVRVCAKEGGLAEEIFIVGWAGVAEYISSGMVQRDQSAISVLIPDDQHASTSRGLFEFGTDVFERRRP